MLNVVSVAGQFCSQHCVGNAVEKGEGVLEESTGVLEEGEEVLEESIGVLEEGEGVLGESIGVA